MLIGTTAAVVENMPVVDGNSIELVFADGSSPQYGLEANNAVYLGSK